MADNRINNKIFSEEDFDKPSQQGNWFSVHIKQVILSALIIICIILTIIFVTRGCTNDGKPVVDTLVTDTIRKNSIVPVVKDSVSSDSIITTQIVAEEEPKDISVSITKTNKRNVNNTVSQDVVKNSEDIEKEALSVIRGNYGNNPERRRLLKDRYQEIQNKVNEMYRNGLVR